MSRYSVLAAILCSFMMVACVPAQPVNTDAGTATSESAKEQEEPDKQEAPAPEDVSSEEVATEEAASEDTVSKEQGKLHMTTIDGKTPEDDNTETDDVPEDGELTARELVIIGRDLNSNEYYGFLMSDYEDPKFIDWDEVLYNGAGIDEGYPSGDVEKEYLRKTGEFEIYTDITVISGEKLEKFVEETTGLSYSKMRNPLDWIYLKNFDLYLFEHGDTNKTNSEIISGYVRDGIYYVKYMHSGWWGKNADHEYTVAFRKNGDRYCFISNIPDDEVSPSAAGGEYLIPESDSRYITEADIGGMDNDTLRLARNEIYARHGRKFADKSLQSYFNGKSWYEATAEPDEVTEADLNKFEAYNVKFIKKYEK